ncbi:MAG: nitrous oxide reductase accessory protein NosL [Thermomicrobiales bacterium]|jgi:copper chaperone NosL|nr:nitrous oxide reductase accessory protein NosL [Thermomicrobiales bacterium]
MITRRALLATGATLPFVLAGCGDDAASADDPPEIKLGRDNCDRCGMIISEERFASGIVDAKGNALLFDDAGEMVATVQEEGLGERRAWVHGYPSLEWIDATKAWYAVTMETPTPMGSGVFPFDSEQEATTFAAEQGGMVFRWEELLSSWTFDAMM